MAHGVGSFDTCRHVDQSVHGPDLRRAAPRDLAEAGTDLRAFLPIRVASDNDSDPTRETARPRKPSKRTVCFRTACSRSSMAFVSFVSSAAKRSNRIDSMTRLAVCERRFTESIAYRALWLYEGLLPSPRKKSFRSGVMRVAVTPERAGPASSRVAARTNGQFHQRFDCPVSRHRFLQSLPTQAKLLWLLLAPIALIGYLLAWAFGAWNRDGLLLAKAGLKSILFT